MLSLLRLSIVSCVVSYLALGPVLNTKLVLGLGLDSLIILLIVEY